MSTKLTQAELAAESDRADARRYFWWWLGVTTALSLGGNVAHALLPSIPAVVVKVAVALVPPAVALAAIHGLTVFARCGGIKRHDRMGASFVYWITVTVTAVLAVGALVLSFDALRGFALAGGVRPAFAGAWPLIVDLGIAVSSFALVVLRPASAADLRAARASANTQVKVDNVSPNTIAPAPQSATPVRRLSASTATPKRAAGTATPASAAMRDRDSAAPPGAESATPSADDPIRQLAAELVARKLTRKPVEVVARILAAHDSGDPLNRIAKNIGVHHSAVSRIISAAAAHHQRALAAV